jgi:hypothetical protein
VLVDVGVVESYACPHGGHHGVDASANEEVEEVWDAVSGRGGRGSM